MTVSIPEGFPLVLVQHPPYRGSLARSALDVAMSFAVFAQSPTLLYAGDGVLCLVQEQDPSVLERKSLRKVIDSLPLYDVDTVYVDAEALARRAVDASRLPAGAQLVDADALSLLYARAGHILSF